MKLCPNCKAELDENAHFCLRCMTSLEEKEQIQPPVYKTRRWPLVVLCSLLLVALVLVIVCSDSAISENASQSGTAEASSAAAQTTEASREPITTVTQTVDGVRYTFRPATGEDHPTAVNLHNCYVLIRVEGTPPDGVYRVPSFVNDNTNTLVTVIADGAFSGTDARVIDLGYNVCFVWGDAFGGYPLTDLHLHEDVFIDLMAFSGCTEHFTIHCPDYLENKEGSLWSDLAADYGFRWQDALI